MPKKYIKRKSQTSFIMQKKKKKCVYMMSNKAIFDGNKTVHQDMFHTNKTKKHPTKHVMPLKPGKNVNKKHTFLPFKPEKQRMVYKTAHNIS